MLYKVEGSHQGLKYNRFPSRVCLSPILFNLFMGRIMRGTLDKGKSGGVERAPMYSDDLALVAGYIKY